MTDRGQRPGRASATARGVSTSLACGALGALGALVWWQDLALALAVFVVGSLIGSAVFLGLSAGGPDPPAEP